MENPNNIQAFCAEHSPKPVTFDGDPKTLVGKHVKLAFETTEPPEEYADRWPTKEHMWVKVKSVDGETLTGILDNEPAFLDYVELGDEITFDVNEIEDVFAEGNA